MNQQVTFAELEVGDVIDMINPVFANQISVARACNVSSQ